MESSDDIVPSSGWGEILDELRSDPCVVMVIGATDAGKSSFARWLAASLVQSGIATALVDADVGQSFLCIPGTVSSKTFPPRSPPLFRAERFVFLGTPSPLKVAAQIPAAIERLVRLARQEAQAVIIDTSGLVTGILGRGMKGGEFKGAHPDMVVALQRSGECEPVLEMLDEVRLRRLAPSHLVRRRSAEKRARSRRERVRRWFAGEEMKEFVLEWRGVQSLRLGRPVSHAELETELRPGTVVGISRGGDTLSLGCITEFDRTGVTFRSSIESLRGVDRLLFGKIVLEPEEEETAALPLVD